MFVCVLPWLTFDSVELLGKLFAICLSDITVVYVQITLLWRYFTLEITLGSKKNTQFLLSSPTVRLNLILILSLADMKWKQYLPLLPLPASK